MSFLSEEGERYRQVLSANPEHHDRRSLCRLRLSDAGVLAVRLKPGLQKYGDTLAQFVYTRNPCGRDSRRPCQPAREATVSRARPRGGAVNPQLWERVESALHQALALAESDRPQFVASIADA